MSLSGHNRDRALALGWSIRRAQIERNRMANDKLNEHTGSLSKFMDMLHESSTPLDESNPKDARGDVKPDLSLVPPASLIHEALAMENGAKKYGPYNWRAKKVRARVYIAAAMRHLSQFLDGEDIASDSLVHHLAHTKACCGILLDAIETGNLIDDRPAKGAATRLLQPRCKPFTRAW